METQVRKLWVFDCPLCHSQLRYDRYSLGEGECYNCCEYINNELVDNVAFTEQPEKLRFRQIEYKQTALPTITD